MMDPSERERLLSAARRALAIRADPVTRARVEVLAEKCNEGQLTPEERAEYECYVSTSTLLATVQAKARALLADHDKSE